MKILIIYILAIVFVFTTAQGVFALTPSPTESQSTSSGDLDPSVKSLKDKLESKVEEMTKGQQKVITGNIEKIQSDSIIISYQNQKLTLSTDDTITTFYSVSNGKKQINKSDLKIGDYLILKGVIIDNNITANTVYRDDEYIVTSGKITDINTDTGTLKVVTIDKENLTVDIEKTTKQQMIDIKSLEFVPTGLSKIKEGDTIHIVAKKPAGDTVTKVTADRILIIPQEYFISPTVTPNPTLPVTPTVTISPKKITPTTKAVK